MEEGGLDAAFFIVYVGQGPQTNEGYDKAYAQAVAKFDAIHRLTEQIAPTQDRPGADGRRRADDRGVGRKVALIGVENAYPIGTDLSRIKEFHDRGGALPVAGAQRAQPVRRLEHRRARRQVAAQRPERPRQAGHRRDEPRRLHDRPVASVEAVQPAGHRAVEGAGDRVALLGAGRRQPQPQPRRRAADGDQEERRRGADGGLRRLREDQAARLTRARRGAGRGPQGDAGRAAPAR